MGDLLQFRGVTTGPVAVEKVTSAAAETCAEVLILGWTEDGMPYYASSGMNKAELLLLLEDFKYRLLSGEYE